MGIFGDKLLLKLNASPTSSGQLDFQVEKRDKRTRHLLPFSCVSLIGSQLTVLTHRHPRSLSKKILDFVNEPKKVFETTSIVSGFKLEIFKGKKQILYNQFTPIYSNANDNLLQADIEQILMSYLTTVFYKSGNKEKSNLQVFLLMTVMFYQQELIPIIRQIDMYNINQRKRLAKTVMDFTSALYHSWDNPKSIAPNNKLFTENLNKSKEFSAYLI